MPQPLSQQPVSQRMVTALKPCHHPQSPKGIFPGTQAASRDQRPWMAAGRRPSWGVPRSSWGLSPWQNPPEPTSTATSPSGPYRGAGLEGTAAGGGQGSPSSGTLGPSMAPALEADAAWLQGAPGHFTWHCLAPLPRHWDSGHTRVPCSLPRHHRHGLLLPGLPAGSGRGLGTEAVSAGN